MSEEPLRSLANRSNQSILGLLAVEPSYPRRVATLLGLAETEVARRLKHMEGLGLVRSEWTRVGGAEGKNVKSYRLTAERVALRFAPDGVHVEISGEGAVATRTTSDPVLEAPPPLPEFVGRDADLKAMDGPESVVIVEGLNGIGKTSLLSAYARTRAQDRAVYWHSFRGVESLTWLGNQIAVFLAQRGDRTLLDAVEGGAELADRRERMLRAFDANHRLFVFDEVHRVEDEDVRAFLGDVITRARSAKVLLGCRERPRFDPTLGHVKVLRLAGLSDGDVARVLEQRGLRLPSTLFPKLRDEVGGHPIALNLLLATADEAARREGGAEDPAARRRALEQLLDRVPEKDLQEWLLQEVYEGLSEAEKEVLAHASLFRTTFAPEDLAAVSRRNVEGLLFALRRKLLVESDGDHYALHEVLRNFFYNTLREKPTWHGKLAAHYLTQDSIPGRLEAMHHFLQAGKRDKVLDLLDQDLDLHDFDFLGSGHQNLYLRILDEFRRDEVRDPRRWALIEDERGDCHLSRGDAAKALAHYDEALALFRGKKDAERVADLAWKRALCLDRMGRKADAKAAATEGLGAKPQGQARERLDKLLATLK